MTSDGQQQPPPLPEPGPAGQPAPGQAYPAQPYGGQAYPVQPYGGYAGPAGPPPDNYLVWAILSAVLCCLPLGIVSIVYAAQVNDKWLRGDAAGAMESSRKAKQFATWSAIVTVVLYVVFAIIYVGIFAVAIGAGVATSP